MKVLLVRICQAIESEPATICQLADEFASAGLIVQATQSSVKFIDGKSPYEKASMMMNAVLDKACHSPQHGSQLVVILDRVGFKDLAAEINTICKCAFMTVMSNECTCLHFFQKNIVFFEVLPRIL